MKLNINEMQVKGMQQSAPYNTGDWFMPLCKDLSINPEAGAQFNMPEHEYANRALFLMQAPLTRGRVFSDVCFLLGVSPALQVSSFGRWADSEATDFWVGRGWGILERLHELDSFVTFNNSSKSTEKCRAEHGCTPRDYLEAQVLARVHEINSTLGFIQAVVDLALIHVDILGMKLHPETVKAARNYPEQYLLKVGDTSVLGVRHSAYLDRGDASVGTVWGTFFDDAISCGELMQGHSLGRPLINAAGAFFRCIHLANLYFVNGRQAIVGLGFQDTNPMFVLSKFTPSGKLVTSSVRVGRYFSAYADLIDIRDNIEDLKVLNCEMQTYLCKTEQEWHDGYNGGVHSCMAGFPFCDSPVRIYATTSHNLPDNNLRLLIQYTGELFGGDFKVHARAIVNIEKMQYVRAYGKNSDGILRALGYVENRECLDGCILAKLRNEGGYWMMIYSDGEHDSVDDFDDYWRLTYSGDAGADTACGYLEDYDTEYNRVLRERCDEYEHASEVVEVETEDATEEWCECCRSAYATYIRRRGWVSDELLESEQEDADEDEDEDAA